MSEKYYQAGKCCQLAWLGKVRENLDAPWQGAEKAKTRLHPADSR
jgi:hypothetical protein